MFDGTLLCIAVEPVAIERCETAVSEGVSVTFWIAREPLSRSRPMPEFFGRTLLAMY